jgi:hypothetical protein
MKAEEKKVLCKLYTTLYVCTIIEASFFIYQHRNID